jgi:hypothetical protein
MITAELTNQILKSNLRDNNRSRFSIVDNQERECPGGNEVILFPRLALLLLLRAHVGLFSIGRHHQKCLASCIPTAWTPTIHRADLSVSLASNGCCEVSERFTLWNNLGCCHAADQGDLGLNTFHILAFKRRSS